MKWPTQVCTGAALAPGTGYTTGASAISCFRPCSIILLPGADELIQ